MITLDGAEELTLRINDLLQPDLTYRIGIYDFSDVKSVDDDARIYFHENENIKGKAAAVALVSSTFRGKMLSNLFVTLKGSTEHPVRSFDSIVEADKWATTVMAEAKSYAKTLNKVLT